MIWQIYKVFFTYHFTRSLSFVAAAKFSLFTFHFSLKIANFANSFAKLQCTRQCKEKQAFLLHCSRFFVTLQTRTKPSITQLCFRFAVKTIT